jgi:hypothetical protein
MPPDRTDQAFLHVVIDAGASLVTGGRPPTAPAGPMEREAAPVFPSVVRLLDTPDLPAP